MNIIEHAEHFLGKISQAWKDKSVTDGLQVVCFQNNPFEAVDVFMTIGLSHHELSISNNKKVRQELVFPVSGTKPSDLIIRCLLSICEFILRDHKALLRGQVILLPKEAADKLGLEAVYCTMPVFLDDCFATFNESSPPTVIVWIIPIYKMEADFIAVNGWDRFEDILEEKNPDLFSLERKPII